MSYDIYLCDPVTKETIEIDEPHFMRGGTYQVGGSTRLHLNVTYNYALHLRRVMGDQGIRGLYGLSGAQSIPQLTAAIEALGDEVDDNYWEPTEGNVKRALIQLKTMASMRPDGIWDGD